MLVCFNKNKYQHVPISVLMPMRFPLNAQQAQIDSIHLRFSFVSIFIFPTFSWASYETILILKAQLWSQFQLLVHESGILSNNIFFGNTLVALSHSKDIYKMSFQSVLSDSTHPKHTTEPRIKETILCQKRHKKLFNTQNIFHSCAVCHLTPCT